MGCSPKRSETTSGAGACVPRFCSTGGSTSITFTPLAGDRYYIAVPLNAPREAQVLPPEFWIDCRSLADIVAKAMPAYQALVAAVAEAFPSDTDSRQQQGATPLHLAASRGNRELVDRLIDAGATATEMADGKTPADLAAERGFPELATHLST